METLYDKASLILNPGIYDTGKVYCTKPLDGSGDLTFTRASDATRVNADGLIEKVRTNLVLQSNTFNTTWGVGGTLVGGQADKDGGTSAWSFTSAGATSALVQNITTGGVQTFSLYIKKNATYGIRIYLFGSLNAATFFDLNNGAVVSSTGGTVNASIEAYNSEWWRVSVTCNSTLSQIALYTTDNGGVQVTGTITIQNAQLEQGDIATDYIPTTTAAVSVGPVSGLPRLDYSGGATCPSLLLEPQTTALLTYSEQLDNASWTKTNTTISANAATSPDGYQNADTITGNGVTGNHYILQSISATNGQSYTCSIFAKAGTSNYLQLIMGASPFGSTNYCNYDLSDGTIGSYGGTTSNRFIQSFGNGWYRIGFTCSATSTASGNFFPTLITSKTSVFFESNSTTGSVNVWGANITATSYVQSYVPTLGSAVTRLADSAYKTGISSLIGQTEGTFFLEFMTPETNSYFINAISDGTNNNKVQIEYNTTSDTLIGIVRVAGVTEVSIAATGMTPNTRYKAAIAYKANDFVFYVNGTQKGTDTSGGVPSSMSAIHLGSQVGTVFESGEIYNATLFKTRLTNAQLAELTTL